jgi:DNA polymerase-3 subunit alpha
VTALAALARQTASELVVEVRDWFDLDRLDALLRGQRGRGRGTVYAHVETAAGLARLRLGSDFLIDHELEQGAQRMAARAAGPEATVQLRVV